jgi:hypothetical protein
MQNSMVQAVAGKTWAPAFRGTDRPQHGDTRIHEQLPGRPAV